MKGQQGVSKRHLTPMCCMLVSTRSRKQDEMGSIWKSKSTRDNGQWTATVVSTHSTLRAWEVATGMRIGRVGLCARQWGEIGHGEWVATGCHSDMTWQIMQVYPSWWMDHMGPGAGAGAQSHMPGRGMPENLCGYKFWVRELVKNRMRAPVITGWGGDQNWLTDWIATSSWQVKMAPVLSPQAGNCSGGLVLSVIRAGELVLNSGFEPVRTTGSFDHSCFTIIKVYYTWHVLIIQVSRESEGLQVM